MVTLALLVIVRIIFLVQPIAQMAIQDILFMAQELVQMALLTAFQQGWGLQMLPILRCIL